MGADRLLLLLLLVILFLAPLGEGSATPLALFILHTLVLCGAMLALFLPASGSAWNAAARGVAIAAVSLVAVACLASHDSLYPFASFLRLLDWLILLLLFTISLLRPWTPGEKGMLADVALGAATLQAGAVLFGMSQGTTAAILKSFGLLNANHQAAYLLAVGLLTLPRLDFQNHRKGSVVRLILASLSLLACTLLMSRGAFLGSIAGIAVLLTLRFRNLSRGERLVVGLSLGLVLTAGAAALLSRFGSSVDPYRYERVGIWGADLRCFAGHPWLGVGAGIFRHVAARFNFPLNEPVRFGRSFETPHSDYLGLLAELGLVGFAAGLVLLVRSLHSLARLGGRQDRFAEGIMAACAALAAQGLVEDLSTRPAIMVTLAILLGAALAGPGLAAHPRRRPTSRIDPLRRLAAALLVLFWWVAVRNPYLAFVKHQAMGQSRTYRAMERNFREAIRLNPYQASTYLFPASAFIASRPEAPLSLDLYSRFRHDLDGGIHADRASADLRVALARVEVRALRSLFHDAASRDRAIVAYRAAIRLAPHDPRIRLELAAFLREVGRRGEAARQIRLALQEEPNYLTAQLLAARLLLEEGRRPEAIATWRAAERIRSTLSTYRPDSAYASDIVRDPVPLRTALEQELGPS
jgi:O-antigen ligase/tetratricopeptide (TPR) repeat protein